MSCMHAMACTSKFVTSGCGTGRCIGMQVLPLPPCPKLNDAIGVLENTESFAFAGQPVNGDAPLSLGFLPLKDNSSPRTANIILWPEHNFWKIREPEELYKYLEAAFPQVQYIRKVVSKDQARRFLETRPIQFHVPQTCSRLCALFEDSQHVEVSKADQASSIKGGAVVILGDAAHVFPPGAVSTLAHVLHVYFQAAALVVFKLLLQAVAAKEDVSGHVSANPVLKPCSNGLLWQSGRVMLAFSQHEVHRIWLPDPLCVSAKLFGVSFARCMIAFHNAHKLN
jgi:hypothetical protein